MRYDDLKFDQTEKGVEFHYKTRKGRTRIYGGKVIENVCQAIARCIIAEQMLKIGKRYKVVLTVHDQWKAVTGQPIYKCALCGMFMRIEK